MHACCITQEDLLQLLKNYKYLIKLQLNIKKGIRFATNNVIINIIKNRKRSYAKFCVHNDIFLYGVKHMRIDAKKIEIKK